MEDLLQLLKTRRSIRAYAPRQVPDDILCKILETAAFAPNAGSRQTTQIVVCQNAEINERLGQINKAAFHGFISSGNRYISRDQPSIADDPLIVSAFYGAPTVVTLFGPGDFLYTEADCWVMAEAIVLAAWSLGVVSCLVARAGDTFSSPFGRKLLRQWNVPHDYEAVVHITLGFPLALPPQARPRHYPKPICVR